MLVTHWEGLHVPVGRTVERSWADLCTWLGTPGPYVRDGAGWSPSTFDGCKRGKDYVRSIGAMVYDVDSGGVSAESVLRALEGLSAVAHPTRKSTDKLPRWRLVVELAAPLRPDTYASAWAQLAAQLHLRLDVACRDASRFWFGPQVPDKVAWRDYGEDSPGEPYPWELLRSEGEPWRYDPRGRLVRAVATAPQGERNSTLNRVAYTLGGLGAGPEVEADLVAAAEIAGLGRDEATDVTRRALAAGARRPIGGAEPAPVPQLEVAPNDKGIAQVAQAVAHLPVGLDVFTGRMMVRGALPLDPPDARIPRPYEDSDDTRIRLWLSRSGIQSGADMVRAALSWHAERHPYHPIRDWLGSLPPWDGTPRLQRWLSDYLGARDTEHTASVGLCWLVAAVARVMHPGCQADGILVLEGDQGVGKSSALRILGGEWYCDSPGGPIGSKDWIQQIHTAWIHEIAELDAVLRADPSTVKAAVSVREDTWRPPYGVRPVTRPRQCVFSGSINPRPGGYLRDETGHRRWWVVRCGRIDLRALARDRDQLWAEALARHQSSEPWHLDQRAHYLAELTAAERSEQDPWEDHLRQLVASIPALQPVALVDAYHHLSIDPGKLERKHLGRVSRCLMQLGGAGAKVTTVPRHGITCKAIRPGPEGWCLTPHEDESS